MPSSCYFYLVSVCVWACMTINSNYIYNLWDAKKKYVFWFVFRRYTLYISGEKWLNLLPVMHSNSYGYEKPTRKKKQNTFDYVSTIDIFSNLFIIFSTLIRGAKISDYLHLCTQAYKTVHCTNKRTETKRQRQRVKKANKQ